MVLNTQQRISTIIHASTLQDPFCTSTMQELPHATTTQESLWCSIPNNRLAQSSMLPRYRTISTLPRCRNFVSLVPRVYYGAQYPTTDQHNRPYFHSVGPFPHFHGVGIYPFLFQESLWCLIPSNESAQSSMFPWYKTFSTLPQCRNFSTLPRHRNHYGVQYPTTYQHNRPCFHGIGPFPHFHGVKTFPHFHNARIIMVLDTQQRINTIFYASMEQNPSHTSMVQELRLSCSRSLLWCFIFDNRLSQSSMLPQYRTFSTLPWCRNFSTLLRSHSSSMLFRFPLCLTNLILRLTSGNVVRLTTPQSPSS